MLRSEDKGIHRLTAAACEVRLNANVSTSVCGAATGTEEGTEDDDLPLLPGSKFGRGQQVPALRTASGRGGLVLFRDALRARRDGARFTRADRGSGTGEPAEAGVRKHAGRGDRAPEEIVAAIPVRDARPWAGGFTGRV